MCAPKINELKIHLDSLKEKNILKDWDLRLSKNWNRTELSLLL